MVKIIGLISLLLIAVNCNTTEPSTNDIQPGRRDYVWTVDTLFLPFNPFTDMTGTSPADLWVCSPGDADKIFYHYNGQNWQTDLIPRPFSPKSIFCFSNNNVWGSGRTGMIWKFNGEQWSQEYKHKVNDNDDITFENIYAATSNDIFAVGQYFTNQDYWGIILRFNGISWIELSIPEIRTAFIKVRKSANGKLYLWGVTNEQFSESRY